MLSMLNGEYYSFSEDLKNLLEDKLTTLLSSCLNFYEKSEIYKKNFAVYIRETDPFNQFKNKHYFIIELDDHTLLDFYGYYDPKTNTIAEIRFRGILYQHTSWDYHYFEKVQLSEEEKTFFFNQQEELKKNLDNIQMYAITDIDEFNPDLDCIPESVVEFYHKEIKFPDLINNEEIITKLLDIYYDYNYLMKTTFNKHLDKINA